jgi:hypothetical protein
MAKREGATPGGYARLFHQTKVPLEIPVYPTEVLCLPKHAG